MVDFKSNYKLDFTSDYLKQDEYKCANVRDGRRSKVKGARSRVDVGSKVDTDLGAQPCSKVRGRVVGTVANA